MWEDSWDGVKQHLHIIHHMDMNVASFRMGQVSNFISIYSSSVHFYF
jgi:hypothetical protein